VIAEPLSQANLENSNQKTGLILNHEKRWKAGFSVRNTPAQTDVVRAKVSEPQRFVAPADKAKIRAPPAANLVGQGPCP
jgi:hypothetical protein